MVRVKPLSMVFKDIQVFFRDYRSFILLFITPLVIAGSIGVVYLNAQPTDVKVILCSDTEKGKIYDAVFDSLLTSGIFTIMEENGNCTQEIGESITASDARLGIIINSYSFYNQMSEYNTTVEIIYDNSKPIGTIIQSHVTIIANRVSKEIINSAIGVARDELKNTVDQVDTNVEQLTSYLDDLKTLRSSIIAVRSDLSAAKESLEAINTLIDEMDESINSIDSTIDDLYMFDSDIQETRNRIDVVIASLSVLNGTETIRDELSDLSYTLSLIQDTTGNIAATMTSSRNNLQIVRDQLDIQFVIDSIDAIEDDLDDIAVQFDNVVVLIEDSISEIQIIRNYLYEKIEEVPQQFEEPIKTKIKGQFAGSSFITFMFPTIIITILLWISIFLSSVAFIKQRNQGILKRISITPTRTATIIISKILVYTLISLLFLPLIFLLGIFVFGVQISLSSIIPVVIIYTIASMIFVLQGLTIGSLTRSENSATLASLMLVIPLMFLSGTFFPQESLPEPLKWYTPFMPVNIAVNLIEGFFFYEFTMTYLLLMFTRMFVYLLIYGIIAWLFLIPVSYTHLTLPTN